MNERIFCRYYKKHQETVATSRDKHTNSNNSTALMGLKNVSTDIIAARDRGDIKAILPPVSTFLKQEINKLVENLISLLSLAVFMPEIKVIFEERATIFEYKGDLLERRQKIVHINRF